MTPYGYRITEGRAEPVPEEHRRLREFFDGYLSGLSIRDAAARAGIPRSASCCRSMLTNPVYLGTDYYPPLIEPELMERAAARAEARSAHLRGIPHSQAAKPVPVRTEFSLPPPEELSGLDAAQLYERITSK